MIGKGTLKIGADVRVLELDSNGDYQGMTGVLVEMNGPSEEGDDYGVSILDDITDFYRTVYFCEHELEVI